MNEPDMKYQGYLSALTSAAATISLLPLSWATTHLFGDVKVPVMLLGSCAYLVEMAIFANADLSEDTLVRGQSLCCQSSGHAPRKLRLPRRDGHLCERGSE